MILGINALLMETAVSGSIEHGWAFMHEWVWFTVIFPTLFIVSAIGIAFVGTPLTRFAWKREKWSSKHPITVALLDDEPTQFEWAIGPGLVFSVALLMLQLRSDDPVSFATVLVLAGGGLLGIGVRAPIGVEPNCRRCEYTQTIPPLSETCSECGSDLTQPLAIVLGRDRARWLLIGLGLAVLGAGVVLHAVWD